MSDDRKGVVSFPSGPRQDELIERVSGEADTDERLAGYVVLIIDHEQGMSFKFAVPSDRSDIDRMLGALDRIKVRLMQHGGELGGR